MLLWGEKGVGMDDKWLGIPCFLKWLLKLNIKALQRSDVIHRDRGRVVVLCNYCRLYPRIWLHMKKCVFLHCLPKRFRIRKSIFQTRKPALPNGKFLFLLECCKYFLLWFCTHQCVRYLIPVKMAGRACLEVYQASFATARKDFPDRFVVSRCEGKLCKWVN